MRGTLRHVDWAREVGIEVLGSTDGMEPGGGVEAREAWRRAELGPSSSGIGSHHVPPTPPPPPFPVRLIPVVLR